MHKAASTVAQHELSVFIQELQVLPSVGHATTQKRTKENSVLLDLSGRRYRILLTAIMKMEQDLAMFNTRRHSWFSGQLFSTKESKQDFDTRPKNLKNP